MYLYTRPQFVFYYGFRQYDFSNQLCVKTMYQARDKEIVEVPWFSTL